LSTSQVWYLLLYLHSVFLYSTMLENY
jgi:hypothetical protein